MQEEESTYVTSLISCGSTRFTKAWKGYATMDFDVEVVAYAVEKTRYWSKGAPNVILMTDHHSLIIMSTTFDNERLMCTSESISSFSLKFHYLNGRYNKIVEALS